MVKFRLSLTGTKRGKIINAKTSSEAKRKYYASKEHFRTERSVRSVKKIV